MPRREVMRHMMQNNLGLTTNRQTNYEFRHALCTNYIINDCTVSLETRERSYLFPLYLYPGTETQNLFSAQEQAKGKQPNINPEIFADLSEIYGELPSPEMVFYYTYAVLYAETYRKKYAAFLKIDFPRIPFTKDYAMFRETAEYGQRLADLHLMKSPDLDTPVARFQGSGDERVEKLRYDKKTDRVYINKNQYFENVPENIWQYHVGGYQVCNKWLKDRKDRFLSLSDVKHYCKIVIAIAKTIEIQKAIEGIFSGIEKNTISFRSI